MPMTRRVALGAALSLPFAPPVRAQDIGTAARPLRVGVTSGVHAQVLERVRDLVQPGGLTLRITEFSDFIQPNAALAGGDIDANTYQHRPFLDQQVRDRRYPLVPVGRTVMTAMAVFSRKARAAADLPAGARVAIPNDPTNGGRALVLLANAGVIKLRDGAGVTAGTADIVANPKKYRFIELDAAQLPRSLPDVDAAAVNNNYAVQAGLDPVRDSIVKEQGEGPWVNIIAVRDEDKDKPWVASFVKAYQSEPVKQFIAEKFKGAYQAAW